MWANDRRPAHPLRPARGPDRAQRSAPRCVDSFTGLDPSTLDLPIRELDPPGRTRAGRLCLTPDGGVLSVGGTAEHPGGSAAADARWGSRSPAESRSGSCHRRATRDAALGPAGCASAAPRCPPRPHGARLYAVIFLVLLPVLWLVSLRLLADSRGRPGGVSRRGRPRSRSWPSLNASLWALITPAWHGPDEPDHFAYAQSVAERGRRRPSSSPTAPPFSSAVRVRAQRGTHLLGVGLATRRPPWLPADERALPSGAGRERRAARTTAAGISFSTSSTCPAITCSRCPPTSRPIPGARSPSSPRCGSSPRCSLRSRRAVRVPDRARAARRRSEWLAAAAGLLVAFHPMVSFMFGVVNNDAGVNAAAALLVFLLVRGLRRGLSLPLGHRPRQRRCAAARDEGDLVPPSTPLLSLGRRHGLAPRRPRRSTRLRGAAGAAAAAPSIRAAVVVRARAPESRVAPGGLAGASAGGTIDRVLDDPATFLSYTWQMFLPRLTLHDRPPRPEVAGVRRLHRGRLGGLRLAGRPLPAMGLPGDRGRRASLWLRSAWWPSCGAGRGARRSAGSWPCSSSRSPVSSAVSRAPTSQAAAAGPRRAGAVHLHRLVPLALAVARARVPHRGGDAGRGCPRRRVDRAGLRLTAAGAHGLLRVSRSALALSQGLAQPASTCRAASSHDASLTWASPLGAALPQLAIVEQSARGRLRSRPDPARRARSPPSRPSSASVLPPARSTHGSPQASISCGISE